MWLQWTQETRSYQKAPKQPKHVKAFQLIPGLSRGTATSQRLLDPYVYICQNKNGWFANFAGVIRPPSPKEITIFKFKHGWPCCQDSGGFKSPFIYIYISQRFVVLMVHQKEGIQLQMHATFCNTHIAKNIHTFGHSVSWCNCTGALVVLTWALSHKDMQEHAFETL